MSSTFNVRLVRKQPLQRKSPLLRKTPLKRHAELRRISLRRARLIRAAQAERGAFVEKFRRCAYPGCGRSSTCIHEIAFSRGSPAGVWRALHVASRLHRTQPERCWIS